MSIKMIDLTEMNKLKTELKEDLVQKKVWGVLSKFPHIITQHPHGYKSDTITFFGTLQCAFEYRHSISSYYANAWHDCIEFGLHRCSAEDVVET